MTFHRPMMAAAALVAIAMSAAFAAAPYLPRLIVEGYPPAVEPEGGFDTEAYASIAGARFKRALLPDTSRSALNAASRELFDGSGGRALLVSRRGRLLIEHYGDGHGSDTRLNSYSMVKTLVGGLVLRAHSDGRIADLNDPVGRYLDQMPDPGVRAIRLIDLLLMRSGLVFEAGGTEGLASGPKDIEATRRNPFGPMARLHMQGLDALAGGLQPAPERAGKFNYQNVNTAILAAVLEAVYERPLEDVLQDLIWRPAGAGPAVWRRYGPGRPVSAHCCLFATPRDWVRVGTFLLNNGTGQERFLPPGLWRRFLGGGRGQGAVSPVRYGMHVFHDVLDRDGQTLQGRFAYLSGIGGQKVYLMPDRDLVVVRFGEEPQLLHSTLYAAWNSLPVR